MGNSVKKIVQNVLLYPRKNKYDKEYLMLMDKYDQSIKEIEEWVQSPEILAETNSLVKSISAQELLDNNLTDLEYDSEKYYIVHTREFGEVLTESERVVFEFINNNPYALVCFGDEDYFAFTNDGNEITKTFPSRRFNRFFKPEYSPDTLVSYNYMGNVIVKGEILKEALLQVTEKDNADIFLYELILVACNIASRKAGEKSILRIPRVLFSKGLETSKDKVTRINQSGKAYEVLKDEDIRIKESGSGDIYCKVREKGKEIIGLELPQKKVKISVIIPSKDNPQMLISCIEKLDIKADDDIEIVVVDNGSSEENKEIISKFLSGANYKTTYIYEPCEFNYSYMNNIGVKASSGEVVILLNDDIEANGNKWMKVLAAYALRDNTGAVGCKLLYPDGKIQHAGIVCGVDGPAHIFMGEEDSDNTGHGDLCFNRNVLAVTGACLTVRKSLYEETGGLFEELKVGYNDVDFCLTLAEKGYRNVLINDVVLIHHESVSRGKDAKSQAKSVRLKRERNLLVSRHREYMISDPYKGGTRDFELEAQKGKFEWKESNIIKGQTRSANDSEGWIYTCFEELMTEDEGNKKYLKIRGFTLVPGIDNMRFDFDMILEKESVSYIIPLKRTLRSDLSNRFNGTDNTELSGFCQKTELDIPSGEYSIKIYAKDHGNVREIITDTGRAIEI